MKSVTKNLTSEKKLNIIIPIILVIITLPLISRAFTSRNEYRYVEIARSILKRVLQDTKYSKYRLDVVEGNERVIPLYESL